MSSDAPQLEAPEVAWDSDGLEGLPPQTPSTRPPWAPKRLSGRHLVMVEYHLAGMTNREIAETLGMHEVSIGLVLRSPPAQDYILSRVNDLNNEFHAKFRKVVDTFEEALNHESIDVKLKASDMWLKAHGKYQPKHKDQEKQLTAEDVIASLLKGAKNVQINVDQRTTLSDLPPALDDFSYLERTE